MHGTQKTHLRQRLTDINLLRFIYRYSGDLRDIGGKVDDVANLLWETVSIFIVDIFTLSARDRDLIHILSHTYSEILLIFIFDSMHADS